MKALYRLYVRLKLSLKWVSRGVRLPATVPSDEARILGDVITALESVESEDRRKNSVTILGFYRL